MLDVTKNKKILTSSRYLAVELLEKIEIDEAYSNLALRKTIEENELSKEERSLLTELVYGVIQRKMTLDYQLDPFIKKQKNIENWVIQVLRMSLYQMEYLDRIPAHAILNEAANIARVRGHRGIVGLVNGVLRNIQRRGVRNPAEISSLNERLSIQYSLPVWLIDEFIEELGEEEAEKLAASLNERPKLSLRVNLKKISREDAIKELTKEDYRVEASTVSPFGINVNNGVPVESELFKEGFLAVQDESSMLVAPALNVEPNHYVLDACAAPGGKTMHIATSYLDAAKNGCIDALDIHEHKIRLIEENAKRHHVEDLVHAKQMDARTLLNHYEEETFDRVLVDAPCSGLGLMRRRPEIRYNKTVKDIESLQTLQLDILTEASKTLKTGGELVYSTCTITRLENQDVVEAFLKENGTFALVSLDNITDDIKTNPDGTISIYPHQYGTDGFFISKLRKL